MDRTLPSSAGDVSSVPGQGRGELGPHMPCAERPKTKGQKQCCNGCHKDFKDVRIKKTFKQK